MPFPAHGVMARGMAFGIDQSPYAPARGFGAAALIVLYQALVEVGCPADIGFALLIIRGDQQIDEIAQGLSPKKRRARSPGALFRSPPASTLRDKARFPFPA